MPPKDNELLQILMESLRGVEGKLDATVNGLADLAMLFHVNKAQTVTKDECEAKRKELYEDMDRCKAAFHSEEKPAGFSFKDIAKLSPMQAVVFGIMALTLFGLVTQQVTVADVLSKVGATQVKADLK